MEFGIALRAMPYMMNEVMKAGEINEYELKHELPMSFACDDAPCLTVGAVEQYTESLLCYYICRYLTLLHSGLQFLVHC